MLKDVIKKKLYREGKDEPFLKQVRRFGSLLLRKWGLRGETSHEKTLRSAIRQIETSNEVVSFWR